MDIKLNIEKIYDFIEEKDVFKLKAETEKSLKSLHNKTGRGSDFLGWLNLPSSITEAEKRDIKNCAENLRNDVKVVVVIGIGGSYLGSKAVIEALSNSFSPLHKDNSYPQILFAGQNISEDYLFELIKFLDNKEYGIIVISKSGTTTEPALAFRFLREHLERKSGKKKARNRIIAITDKSKGALKKLSEKEGYTTFVIPDDVGGRYSVLTPVGLLPIAVAGFNIDKLIKGAERMQLLTNEDVGFENNPAAIYAAARNSLYRKGKSIEILVNYVPYLQYFSEWWKQLYGESEGKNNKGIFPASVNFTTDLHSMGQYIQEGLRNSFETVISIKKTKHKMVIPKEIENLDNLNYLAGKRIDEVNKMAELGTMMAHIDGGVPNIKIEVPELNEFYLGELIYFFEKACAISGYLLDVNPFDQPGVEAYKSNMFKLLEKPGY